jgi:hypothetical protein
VIAEPFFVKVDDVLPGVAYWESEFEYVECALLMGLPLREFSLGHVRCHGLSYT